MKFNIGYTFVIGFLSYEVVGYNSKTKTYTLREGFMTEYDDQEVTEHELELIAAKGV